MRAAFKKAALKMQLDVGNEPLPVTALMSYSFGDINFS